VEMTKRRTKIVATLGPVSESPEMVGRLIAAGVNVFRLNFSHGTHESHGAAMRAIRAAAAERRSNVAILQDLQGPKMRIGALAGHEPVTLEAGARVRIVTDPILGTAECLSTTYQALPEDVRPDDLILLDDGRLQLKVVSKQGREVVTEVLVGGLLSEHKGMNLPKTPLSAPCLTEKDLDDLRFGLEQGVDFVGLSFVRHGADIERLRRECGVGRKVMVIAKIERVEAIENLAEIVKAADGIMVARGDLAVETSTAEVPVLQKQILATAARYGKPDITATQMLETMVANPQPSRAEATDVANAVFDGTDAVMLSAETAAGKYPVEAVRMMSAIAMHAEEHLEEFRGPASRKAPLECSVAAATVHSAVVAAHELHAKAIAVFTLSGQTAFLVSARRPMQPILAFSPHDETRRKLSLSWGVQAHPMELVPPGGSLDLIADTTLRASGMLRDGDLVVMVAGSSVVAGATNLMKIHRVGASG